MKILKILLFSAITGLILFTPAQSQFTPDTDSNKDDKQYWGPKRNEDGRPVEYVPAPTGTNPKNIRRRPPQQADAPLNDSKITLEYTIFDFGNVPQHTNVTHLFKVSNTGTDTLTIINIKPT
ncbi:MAG: DUF1573 domain-containing protein [candidate division Zixibacteria bacterium]|nr:DUF1573 domain-containing protein [candidate division Zixibacteria bacterium]